MNILYFLEPREELGNPKFRLGTIRNHISKEILAIEKADNNNEVRLLTSDEVRKACLEEKLLSGKNIFAIRQGELKKYFPNEREISKKFFTGEFDKKDENIMHRLCRKAIGNWSPDIIVCYEGAAPYLNSMFPEAVFINSTLGMLSRAPFPELGCFDPCGVFKLSYLKKFENELRSLKASPYQIELLEKLRNKYSQYIKKNNPIRPEDIPGNFDKIILLPLQVTGYFAFDDNLPEGIKCENQLDFVKYVLETVPSSIGVYVTLHGAEDDLFDETTLKILREKHSNFLFSPEIQKIRWCSQWLLPYVDGVATVSSSVGLQAIIWKKPVFTFGDSHVSAFNAGELLDSERLLDEEHDFDGALFHLLTRYYPLMKDQVQNGEWLLSFFHKAIEKKKNGDIKFDYFDKPDSEYLAIERIIKNLNDVQTLTDIERFASHMNSTRVVDIDAAKKSILEHDVVSFDIFDTLITRRLMHPNHLFDLMDIEAREIFSQEGVDLERFGGFRNLRERAANRIIRGVKKAGGEEILFKNIYNEIKKLTGISHQANLKLRKLELRTEKEVITVRDLGKELFDFAISKGKEIILVSDMYLDKKDIEFIIKKNGISGYKECYVSSSFNKLKKTGTLFKVVLDSYPNKEIIHFGDNHLSDVVRAVEAGLSAIHLPMINETYMASRLARDSLSSSEVVDSLSSSLMHGVISRHFYDNKILNDSWFNNSPYRMGFEACGPILLGFTKWVMECAIRDGVEDLYFLARDGYLVKKIYDQIAKNTPNAPKSHYLLASRRCYNTASLKSEQDILDSMSLSFSKVPLHKIMYARFGINKDEINHKTLSASGLNSLDQIVDIKRRSQLNKFKRFLSANKELILEKAEKERNCLLEYLDTMGLNNKRNISVVDIGHNASLQRSLGRLLGSRADIGGYYFMTYHGAKEVFDEGFNIQGYLADFEESRFSSHPYCKNIGMFEFLFLPAIPSFKRFTYDQNNKISEEYVGGDETARFGVINVVHKGVEDYVKVVLRTLNNRIDAYNVSKNRSLKTYIEFIQSPYAKDAAMFDGLSFVDQFGGSDARYLIATPAFNKITADNYSDYIQDSWWREGAASLVNEVSPSNRSYEIKVEKNIDLKIDDLSIYKRKVKKLKNDPKAFLYDSKLAKLIRKAVHISST
ncbi:HAD family hydrolase [Endozoicomonas lisbonensis]|uniref:HAD superfamily hydrolase n=1 Tax=Endozoicomonas lisbonensis TaxID=3120522 RepID=A0ABV2SH34_9GAMM